MRKSRVIAVALAMGIGLAGCSPTTRTVAEIPETEYTQAGYSVKVEVEEDGTVKITYGLIGVKDDKIKYIYLDQIEENPAEDRFLMTNKEMENAYGLSYISDHGEWSTQVRALENYIAGHTMTIEEVNAIPTYEKDEDNLNVPTEGSDLEAGCELDITDFLDVINDAYDNLEDTNATRLGIGEDVRIHNADNRIDVTFSFVGTDYRYKICYEHLDTYSVYGEPGADIRSQKEKAEEQPELFEWQKGIEGFEEYIMGLNMTEAYGVETYDPGNGIETALPKAGTDLAEVCNIDLDKFIITLREAAGRL